MKKMANPEKNHLKNTRKRRISANLLYSYLLILLAPAIAIVAIYFTAQKAMVDTQRERMQSTLSAVRDDFDREVKQAQNAGYYVGQDRSLCNYLLQNTPLSREQEFYSLYTIASNYPNYTLTNQVIQSVFVLIADSQYVMRIPQVIPKTERGIATLDDFPLYSYEKFMEFYETQDQTKTVYYYEDELGKGTLLLPCVANYPYMKPGRSSVVVELDWKQITRMLKPVLAGREGMVAFLDENGRILASVEDADKGGLPPEQGMELDTYLNNCQWGRNNLVICTQASSYNGWSLVGVVPKSVLTERIGPTRYVSVMFCVVAVFIGVMVCLSYWHQRKSMVQEYFQLQERIGQDRTESMWFWKSFDRFLTDVNKLQTTVEHQEGVIRENFLGKLFYGGYDSEEQAREAAKKAGITLGDCCYYVVAMELGDPSQEKMAGRQEGFAAGLSECFGRQLPWSCWCYQVNELLVVLLIQCEEGLSPELLRQELEKLSLELSSRFQVPNYMGISWMAAELMEIPRQYEIASRISELARYRDIRIPVLPSQLPETQAAEQPLFFTIDMELQLLNQIRSGSAEQLEEMIAQIRSVYFRPGNSQYTYRYTIEILRSCLFRSIPMDDESDEARALREETQRVRQEEEILELLRRTWRFCTHLKEEKEGVAFDLDREQVSEYIEEHFGDSGLNLFGLAEWLGESERKLYNDFKLCFGMSFSSYLEQRRIAHACELLKQGIAVKDIAEKVGYSSDYSFRRAFKRVVGIPPSDFRKMQTI